MEDEILPRRFREGTVGAPDVLVGSGAPRVIDPTAWLLPVGSQVAHVVGSPGAQDTRGERGALSAGPLGLLSGRAGRRTGWDRLDEMAADLEARVDLVLERGRITLEEFRAIWVDSDAILRERVAQAVMAGEVDEGAVGPMDEWGLVPFDSYIRRVVSTEVLADGRASPLAQMALVRAGGFVPSRVLYAPGPGDLWVTLGSPAGDKNPPVGTEDLPWYHWRRILEKIVNALGLGGLAGILGQLADLFTGDSMMGALMAALEAGDKKTAKILARGILEKIKKFLAEQATALGERVARVAVKLGIPGWVAGVLAVFLAGMVANAIMDLF